MTVQTIRVHCMVKKCGQVFDAEIAVECPVEVAVASMKAVRCPKCGSRKVGMGGDYNDAPVCGSLEDRKQWWKTRGEVGISSQAIFYAMCGEFPPQHPDFPIDPDDFGRCRKLLDLFPEWRKGIEQASAVFPWLAPFVVRWDEMDRLWDEESPTQQCPKLDELMQVAGEEARKLRGGK